MFISIEIYYSFKYQNIYQQFDKCSNNPFDNFTMMMRKDKTKEKEIFFSILFLQNLREKKNEKENQEMELILNYKTKKIVVDENNNNDTN